MGARSWYPGKYTPTPSKTRGLLVMNSRVSEHSRTMCCKDFLSSGRCFGWGSAKASIHINPRYRDQRDFSSIEFHGATVPDHQLPSWLSLRPHSSHSASPLPPYEFFQECHQHTSDKLDCLLQARKLQYT